MLSSIKIAYFIGVGGIGMSAIARYFNVLGVAVYGYDKTPTLLTQELIEEGINIEFSDSVDALNEVFKNCNKEECLVVITPAIPKDSLLLKYFLDSDFIIKKRAEVLGLITQNTFTAAVSGTHGKTTTSSMLAHILKFSDYDVTAFLGGITKNYNSNLLLSDSKMDLGLIDASGSSFLSFKMDVLNPTVVEADEYDRSFLTLHPNIAIVTSVDADHLDIYGDDAHLKESFQLFTALIKQNGSLITKQGLDYKPRVNEEVNVYEYALTNKADFYATNINIVEGKYEFDIVSCIENINQIRLGLPGLHNLENAVAAIAAAQLMGVVPQQIKMALKSFEGVKRRFDYRINTNQLIFIDDYAHHPEEIKACVNAVRELFPNKKITGIFQPHLYSRTRDFADGFAQSLSLLDQVILLDIYPARELPIEGVTSAMLLSKIENKNKMLLNKQQVIEVLPTLDLEVLLTIGAGDIDQLIKPIENLLTLQMQANAS